MARLTLIDESARFEATLLEARTPVRYALFAVGGGGDPKRHLPLLDSLASHGVTVVAPHFDRVPPRVTGSDLLLRARRLRLAMDVAFPKEVSVVGVGHSIGATILLAMAGGQAWMGPGRPIAIDRDERLRSLVLMAPAAGYFRAPGALDRVRTPILTWAGTEDTITPPSQAESIRQALKDRAAVDLRVEEGAGHFSFMHSPPPHVEETLANPQAFLARLTAEVVSFALS